MRKTFCIPVQIYIWIYSAIILMGVILAGWMYWTCFFMLKFSNIFHDV